MKEEQEEGEEREKMKEEVLRINSTFYFPLPLQESSKPLISCPLPSILGLPGNGSQVVARWRDQHWYMATVTGETKNGR